MKRADHCCEHEHLKSNERRTLLKGAFGVTAATMVGIGAVSIGSAEAASLSKDQRDKMTPDDVVELFRKGNARFRAGKTHSHDFLAQKRASSSGQYPAAVILSCIDSRAPAEIILDAGIGDTFNARIAGNIANDDLIGSLEFACAVAGAKVILVMGHTACGAIRGAIDGAQLGHLTGLLEKIKPAVDATVYDGDRSGKNDAFVDAVARTNVFQTIDEILKSSTVLSDLAKKGTIKVVGSMYDLQTGIVTFI